MTTLVERDVAAMLAFVSELKDLDDPLPFPPRLLQQMHALIPSDWVDYGELNPFDRRSIIQIGASPDGEHELLDGEMADPSELDVFFRVLRPQSPRMRASSNERRLDDAAQGVRLRNASRVRADSDLRRVVPGDTSIIAGLTWVCRQRRRERACSSS